jgi:hypothetical protein
MGVVKKSEAGICILVGAGSSVPFGFPDGRQLVDRFIDYLKSRLPELGVAGIDSAFLAELAAVKPTSIDQLLKLTHDRGYDSLLEHGRLFVENEIGAAQSAAIKVHSEGLVLPWLRKLLDGLGKDCSNYDTFMEAIRPLDGRPALAFYTLNYDLLLEVSILNYLHERFPCRKSDILRDWDLAPQVNHLHGSIGLEAAATYFSTQAASRLSFWWEKSESPLAWGILNAVVNTRDLFATIGFGFHQSVNSRFGGGDRSRILLCTDFDGSSDAGINHLSMQLRARTVLRTTGKCCSEILVRELLAHYARS